jgi:hypothetical protein
LELFAHSVLVLSQLTHVAESSQAHSRDRQPQTSENRSYSSRDIEIKEHHRIHDNTTTRYLQNSSQSTSRYNTNIIAKTKKRRGRQKHTKASKGMLPCLFIRRRHHERYSMQSPATYSSARGDRLHRLPDCTWVGVDNRLPRTIGWWGRRAGRPAGRSEGHASVWRED